jgi:hypothetical protein
MRRRDFVMLLGAAVPCPLKAHAQQAKQPRRIRVLHGLARPALRKGGTTPQTTQRSLALPAFFALIYCLHAVLRALTAGQGALFLAGAYAGIDIAINSQRRRREGNGESVKKHRGQEGK